MDSFGDFGHGLTKQTRIDPLLQQALAVAAAVAFMGTAADGHDNPVVNTLIRQLKVEFIRHDGPNRSVDHVGAWAMT